MAKTKKQLSKFANYERPPINEVVFGVRFQPLNDWLIPHVGAFWQIISDSFPRCEHANPIGDGLVADQATGLIMPRVWLINQEDDRIIQLQAGRFHMNWRKREDSRPYPHFGELSKCFYDYFLKFRNFCIEQKVGEIDVMSYELTYINHIPTEKFWNFPRDVGKVIGQLKWQRPSKRFLPHPAEMRWRATFEVPESQGTLSINLHSAKRQSDGKDLLVLELSMRGRPSESPLDNLKDWFSLANEWVDRGFEDVTSEKAQTELWGRHE